jgi:hypothetical protein
MTKGEMIEELYAGEFMKPECVKGDFATFTGQYGETITVPLGSLNLHTYDNSTLEVRHNAYGVRLSASGYLDCTDWEVFDTLEEAQDYLIEEAPEYDD